MADTHRASVNAHRKRMRQRDMVRVEVQVQKEFAALVRGVAIALSDPEREKRTRDLLRERIVRPSGRDLKESLASAPLERVEIDRPRDFGRRIEV